MFELCIIIRITAFNHCFSRPECEAKDDFRNLKSECVLCSWHTPRQSWMSETEIAKLQRTMKQCHTFKVIFTVRNELWHSDVWPFFFNDAKCRVKLPLVPCFIPYTLNTLPFHSIRHLGQSYSGTWIVCATSLSFNPETFVVNFFFSVHWLLFLASLSLCSFVYRQFTRFPRQFSCLCVCNFPVSTSIDRICVSFFLHFYFVACQLVYIVDAIIATFIMKRGKYVCQKHQKQTDSHSILLFVDGIHTHTQIVYNVAHRKHKYGKRMIP